MANSSVVGVLRALLTADTAEFDAAMAGASKSTTAWSRDFTQLGLTSAQVGDVITNSMTRNLAAVDKLAKGFSGAEIAKKADEYAAAVQRIGGAEKLTAAEAAKVNSVMGEAIAKYQKLGLEAPAHLKKLEAATRDVKAPTDNMASSLQTAWTKIQGLAGAFGIGLTLSSLVSFGKGLIEDAGHLVDLSQKTGLSIEAVQRFGFVAEQTGGTVDDMAKAVFKLGVNLEAPALQKRLKEMGFDLEKIRAMKPEEQFDFFARALSGLDNIQERNTLGVALMGKSYENIAPAIAEYNDLIDKAAVATGDSVRAIDKAADTAAAAMKRVEKGLTVEIGGAIIKAESQWTVFKAVLKEMPGLWGQLHGQALPVNAALTAQAVAQEEVKKTTPVKEVIELTAAQKAAAAATLAHTKAIQAEADTLSGADTARRVADTTAAWNSLNAAQQKSSIEHDKIQKKIRAYVASDGLPALSDELHKVWVREIALVDSQKNVNTNMDALLALIPHVNLNLKDTGAAAQEAFDKMHPFATVTTDATTALADLIRNGNILTTDIDRAVIPALHHWTEALWPLAGAFDQLGLRAIGGVIDQVNGLNGAILHMQEVSADATQGAMGNFLAMIPVIGQAFAFLKGIYDLIPGGPSAAAKALIDEIERLGGTADLGTISDRKRLDFFQKQIDALNRGNASGPPAEFDPGSYDPNQPQITDGWPEMDTPMRRVNRSGYARLNPGDVVGMPHLTPGMGGYNGPNELHVHLGDKTVIVDMVKAAMARGEIQVPARAVRARVSGG